MAAKCVDARILSSPVNDSLAIVGARELSPPTSHRMHHSHQKIIWYQSFTLLWTESHHHPEILFILLILSKKEVRRINLDSHTFRRGKVAFTTALRG
jgi:hypothetical protein